MKTSTLDLMVIIVIALFLLILSEFNLLEKSTKFMFVPLFSFYYLGKFIERKFNK